MKGEDLQQERTGEEGDWSECENAFKAKKINDLAGREKFTVALTTNRLSLYLEYFTLHFRFEKIIFEAN